MYASWPCRVCGYLIDVLAFYAPWLLLPVVDLIVPLGGDRRALVGEVLFSLLLVGPFSVLVFNRWVRGGVTRAFVRDVAHLLDTLVLYLGWRRPLWNAKRQTLADTATRSVVIRG